jgi:eukaryotic-like serine/threonine-protein kinase
LYDAGPPPPGAPLEEPPPDREVWPWLLVLLVLVLAGLAAAWFATHEAKRKTTVTTVTVPAATQSRPAGRSAAGPGKALVPALVGMKLPRALTTLNGAGLQAEVRSVYSDQPRGTVSAQDPAATTSVAKTAVVTLRVSKGPPRVQVPDLVGQRRDDAVKALQAIGLEPGVAPVPSTEPEDIVVAQHPLAGATVVDGDAVRLNVSAGEPTPATAQSPEPGAAAAVTVPDVVGMKLNKARKEIRKAGLVTEVRMVPSDLSEDTVVSQSPSAGTGATHGDHVFVTVASERKG